MNLKKNIVSKIKNNSLKKNLIEGYKIKGKEDLKIIEEWEIK